MNQVWKFAIRSFNNMTCSWWDETGWIASTHENGNLNTCITPEWMVAEAFYDIFSFTFITNTRIDPKLPSKITSGWCLLWCNMCREGWLVFQLEMVNLDPPPPKKKSIFEKLCSQLEWPHSISFFQQINVFHGLEEQPTKNKIIWMTWEAF